MNVTNNGFEDIILEEFTALLVLRAQNAGGGNLPAVFYINGDSTPTVADGGVYTANSKILLGDGASTVVYFGAPSAGGSDLHSTHNDDAIYAANLLIFGYEDKNLNGITDDPPDQPYSQNLPFQALRTE